MSIRTGLTIAAATMLAAVFGATAPAQTAGENEIQVHRGITATTGQPAATGGAVAIVQGMLPGRSTNTLKNTGCTGTSNTVVLVENRRHYRDYYFDPTAGHWLNGFDVERGWRDWTREARERAHARPFVLVTSCGN